MSDVQGFLNLDKPKGWTSHDCVARVRRLLHLKRVGHAGTLDPAATGVLPVALGRATRLLQFLSSEKAYRAVIRFGVTTATDDLEGEVLTERSPSDLTRERVEAVLPEFLGKIEQKPPRYSAIHVGGKRLYERARRGEVVEVPTRTVEVFGLEVLGWRPGEFPELEVAIACGTGTYIRSIARDWGEKVETGATLAGLVRTRSSGFSLEDSVATADLETQVKAGSFVPCDPSAALMHLDAIGLPGEEGKRWCQGQRIPVSGTVDTVLRVYDEEGQFLGIGRIMEGEKTVLAPQVVLHGF
ncbi:MAG: tRNA pseudouridine(55) synthase TruB [Limnospira sp.]